MEPAGEPVTALVPVPSGAGGAPGDPGDLGTVVPPGGSGAPGRGKWALVAAALAAALVIGIPLAAAALNSGHPARSTGAVQVSEEADGSSEPLAASPSGHRVGGLPTASSAPLAKAHQGTKPTGPGPTVTVSAPASKNPSSAKTQRAQQLTTVKVKAVTAREAANSASGSARILIKNLATRMCADVPGYGVGKQDGPVEQYYCDETSSDNQLWNLKVSDKNAGPGGATLFVINNAKDGLCFDIPWYGSVAPGTKVTEYPCDKTSADNQRWYLVPQSGGTYQFRNFDANLCLGVKDGTSARAAAYLDVEKCTSATTQRWSITS
ncbi:RICIN domain-containing protein [Streptomyces sp. NPDC048281]|uniref:RICIN domain-containing protein n=1 Tax=Streptomyces sp. NPDC048281 TaxID=3154715 RepID=UPI00343AF593